MQQWTVSSLVQMMACHLIGDKPSSEPMMFYDQLGLKEQIAMEFEPKYQNFHEKNAFENIVCKMSAILIRPHCDYKLQNKVNAMLL